MSDIIDFLEKMGQDCDLRNATDAELSAALERAGIEPVGQAALLTRDSHTLQAFFGITDQECCLVDPGLEEENDEDGDEADDEEDEDDEDELEEEDELAERISAAGKPASAGEG